LGELDDSMGLSVARLITARFQMLQNARDAAQAAQLPVSTELGQSLQEMAQAVSLIDFNLLEIKDADKSSNAATLPRSG
jgi:hypothetical protein